MNSRFLFAWLALGLFAAGGCAEGPKVVTNFDPSAEFSAFRTFAFSGITDRGHEIEPSDNSRLGRRVQNMVGDQLATKGLRQVGVEDHPDLLVHLFYSVRDLQHVRNAGMTPGPYGPRVATTTYAFHDGKWEKVPASSGGTAHEDHLGTLIVDLTASPNKKLVWRAMIRAVLEDSLEKNFDLARMGIAAAFKDYPPAK